MWFGVSDQGGDIGGREERIREYLGRREAWRGREWEYVTYNVG
jgi:hypothetical protein